MKKLLIVSLACLAASCTHSPSASPDRPAAASSTRIGTYDSRAVALAFSRTPAFKQWLDDLHVRHDQAKAEGNAQRMAELESEGKKQQERLHVQVFNTGAIDDILLHMKDDLPGIREKAGVVDLVSQWDDAGLKKHQDAERVDLTMELVNVFKPTPEVLKLIREVQKQKPVSPDVAKSH